MVIASLTAPGAVTRGQQDDQLQEACIWCWPCSEAAKSGPWAADVLSSCRLSLVGHLSITHLLCVSTSLVLV